MDYRKCVGKIPMDVKNNEFVSIERNAPMKMYSIGFQPAKCIPEIPEWFFNKYMSGEKGKKVLEPFAGSGTTVLEGIKYGHMVYWMDNNPLSRLNCKCKSRSVDVVKLADVLVSMMKNVRGVKRINVTMKFANIDLWFQKEVQEALTIIKMEIAKQTDIAIRDALNLALSITVRKMSEMEDSMILAARRSNNREMITYFREDVYKNYEWNVNKLIAAYEEWNPIVGNEEKGFQVMTNDARRIDKKDYFDAIVTSPPYINAMDYIWASKFELHWLDLVEDDKDRLNVTATEIGTERIAAKEYKELAISENEQLNEILYDIYYGKKYKATKGQNELRSRVTYKYFEDMRVHFASAYDSLKQGGKYCFIIGDTSKICGVEIPVANMLKDIAQGIGFNEVFRFNLLLKNRKLNIPRASFAGTIKHDTIIVLEK